MSLTARHRSQLVSVVVKWHPIARVCLQPAVSERGPGLSLQRRRQGGRGEAGEEGKRKGAFQTVPKERSEPITHPAAGAGGERPAAEGKGRGDPGQAGGPRWRAGQWRRRQRWWRKGLERGRPAAAHQSRQPVSRWNQRQVGAERRCSGPILTK